MKRNIRQFLSKRFSVIEEISCINKTFGWGGGRQEKNIQVRKCVEIPIKKGRARHDNLSTIGFLKDVTCKI